MGIDEDSIWWTNPHDKGTRASNQQIYKGSKLESY